MFEGITGVEVAVSKDYHPPDFARKLWMLAREVKASMESPEQFIKYVHWTPAEKKAARRAFDDALGRNLSAIIAEAKRRMLNVVDPPVTVAVPPMPVAVGFERFTVPAKLNVFTPSPPSILSVPALAMNVSLPLVGLYALKRYMKNS